MKASVGAGILLLLILLSVVLHGWYVTSSTQRMLDMIDALPRTPSADTPQKIQDLEAHIAHQRDILKWTVSYLLLDRLGELTKTLQFYAEAGMAADYQVTRALLADAVMDIRRPEVPWRKAEA